MKPMTLWMRIVVAVVLLLLALPILMSAFALVLGK
jgi:hypothetical protein